MKTKNIVIALSLAIVMIGCAGRAYYNTLASIQVTTSAAYDGYLDMVVTGKVKTNNVPAISKDYNMFQTVWMGAVAVAQFNTNAVAPSAVTDASIKVLNDITSATK